MKSKEYQFIYRVWGKIRDKVYSQAYWEVRDQVGDQAWGRFEIILNYEKYI